MKRVLTARFMHETNTFSRVPTDMAMIISVRPPGSGRIDQVLADGNHRMDVAAWLQGLGLERYVPTRAATMVHRSIRPIPPKFAESE